MMWDDHSGWGSGAWLSMILMMLVVIGLLAWGLYLLWRGPGRERRPADGAARGRSPEETLADRLARGEIDVDEYERRMDALRAGGRGSPTLT